MRAGYQYSAACASRAFPSACGAPAKRLQTLSIVPPHLTAAANGFAEPIAPSTLLTFVLITNEHEKPVRFQTPPTSRGLQSGVWSGCLSPGSAPLLPRREEQIGATTHCPTADHGDPIPGTHVVPCRSCLRSGCRAGTGRLLPLSEQLAWMSQPITSRKEVSRKAVTPRLWHPAVKGQMWRPTHVRCRHAAN